MRYLNIWCDAHISFEVGLIKSYQIDIDLLARGFNLYSMIAVSNYNNDVFYYCRRLDHE